LKKQLGGPRESEEEGRGRRCKKAMGARDRPKKKKF